MALPNGFAGKETKLARSGGEVFLRNQALVKHGKSPPGLNRRQSSFEQCYEALPTSSPTQQKSKRKLQAAVLLSQHVTVDKKAPRYTTPSADTKYRQTTTRDLTWMPHKNSGTAHNQLATPHAGSHTGCSMHPVLQIRRRCATC